MQKVGREAHGVEDRTPCVVEKVWSWRQLLTFWLSIHTSEDNETGD